MRLFIELAAEYPVLGAFLSRGGLRVLAENSLLKAYLPRDLVQGRDCGRIRIPDIDLAFDLVVGPTLTALHRMQCSPLPDGYAAQLVSAILQALGAPHRRGERDRKPAIAPSGAAAGVPAGTGRRAHPSQACRT